MMQSILWTGVIFFAASTSVDGAKNCSLKWNADLPSWFPLIWSNAQIVYPFNNGSGSWQIEMKPKTFLEIGCSDEQSVLKAFELPSISLNCDGYGTLKYSGASAAFKDLGCTSQFKESIVESDTYCQDGSRNINIQFRVSSKNFSLINVCHDVNTDETVMVHHSIHGEALNPYEVSNKRPGFKEAQFYTTISADTAYSQKSQLEIVTELVGSSSLGQKYIDLEKSYYFARGHLAPDGDFVHVYEQNATYYFINVIPQWQAINNGNWKALETAVRNYATTKKTTVKVWTGGKGVLELSDINGNPVKIYLAKDSVGRRLVPVPEISWKVIQDPGRNASVAVFMVNNPHLAEVSSELILCKDICSQLSWVTWDISSITKGYTYCCDMTEAKKVLPLVPDFSNDSVLDYELIQVG